MKKILMLNYEFPPLGGGAGNATYNISKELVKMGYDVTVLTSGWDGGEREEIQEGIRIQRVFSWRKGIHDCGLRGAFSFLFFASWKLLSLRMKAKYDLVHYFFSLPTGLLSFLPWSFRNAPKVVSLRGSDVPHYDKQNRTVYSLSLCLRPLNRRVWKNADKVVALSNSLRATALRTSPGLQIEVISNGVNTELFRPEPIRKDPSQSLRLITVARLVRRKGVEHILKALAQINDKSINLLVVGTGSDRLFLKKLCAELKLDDAVDFFGYCPRAELNRLYNSADLFILPSRSESFGMAFAEAMACALPVIGTKTGGIVDLIDHGEGGILVEPANVEEIAQAILKMKNSPQMRLEMGRKNREKILRKYSWRSVAEQYLEIYKVAGSQ